MPVVVAVVLGLLYILIKEIGFLTFLGWFVVIVAGLALLMKLDGADKRGRAKRLEEQDQTGAVDRGVTGEHMIIHGLPQAELVCPHCQIRGRVLTKEVTKKAGISGAKATGALLTGGVSLLATGLSRKDQLTEAHCVNCNSTWHF